MTQRLLILLIFGCFTCPGSFSLRAQVVLSQTVSVDANGVVLAPTNFWSANASSIALLAGAVSNGVSAAQFAGFTNGLSAVLAAKVSQPFPLQFSGLTASVGAGSILWPDGLSLNFPGGSIALFPNFTNYLVLNYGTGRLHVLHRFLAGGGEHLLATIITGPGGIASPPQVNPDLTGLPTRLGTFKARLLAGGASLGVVLMGDSTTEASGSGIMWKDLLFSTGSSAFGFNVINAASITYRNYGLGGMNADYGLALISRAAQSFGYPFQGYGGHGDPLDFAGAPYGSISRTFTPQAGVSTIVNPLPDLVVIGFGINASSPQSGIYSLPDLECLGRFWQSYGVPTLYLTENDFANSPGSLAMLASAETALMRSVGGAIADTAAYVDERNRQGTNTYVDAVHSNQTGWNAWAEAILGVLNPYPQRATTGVPAPNRVLDPGNPAEAPYLGWGCTWVGGTAINKSPGSQPATNAGGPGIRYLPNAFGWTGLYTVPGTPGIMTNFVDYYHSCWSSASLIFERGVGSGGVGTNSFNGYAAWIDHTGAEHLIRGLSFVDDNNPGGSGPFQRPGMMDLVTVTQILPAISNLAVAGYVSPSSPALWNHGAVRIAITNGNARILGVLFRGPRHRKLSVGRTAPEWVLTPSWFDDVGDPFGWYPHLLACDTPGDSLGIRFRGRGLQCVLRRSPVGGQIAVYGNGRLVQTQDLLAPGRPPALIQWLPLGSSGFGEPPPESDAELVVNYTGDNPAKIGPTWGYHAVTVQDALVIY